MFNYFLIPLSIFASFTTSYKMDGPPPPVEEVVTETEKVEWLTCKGCSKNEILTLNFLQNYGVKDRNALATIMGNIRQESMFIPNICEGGARTSYSNCYGGYGLIQWTSSSRYYGLGKHAHKSGMSPSSLNLQLNYMVNEPQWKSIEGYMMTPGKSIPSYMNVTYRWIGWGIHGARTHYAYDYANRMTTIEI